MRQTIILLFALLLSISMTTKASVKKQLPVSNFFQQTTEKYTNITHHLNDRDFDPRSLIKKVDYSSLKSVQTAKQQLDSTIQKEYDKSTSSLLITEKETFSYNEKGQQIEEINFLFNDSTHLLTTESRTEYTYDSKGNVVAKVLSAWSDSTQQWINIYRQETTYNDFGSETMNASYMWQPTTSSWGGSSKEEIEYDANNNEISYANYQWDILLQQWMLFLKVRFANDTNGNVKKSIVTSWSSYSDKWDTTGNYEYIYDNQGNELEQIRYSRDTLAGNWFASFKVLKTYNADGNVILSTSNSWDATTNQWVVVQKAEYSYDVNGNEIEHIYYSTENETNELLSYYKRESAYDSRGNLLLLLTYGIGKDELWLLENKVEFGYNESNDQIFQIDYDLDETSGKVVEVYKNERSYDTSFSYSDLILPGMLDFSEFFSHKLITNANLLWDTSINDWLNSSIETYYYSEHILTGNSTITSKELRVYPNPATGFITFELKDDQEPALVELFNLQGRKVISETINNGDHVSVQELGKGIFLYNVTQSGKKYSGRIAVK
jgi:hypothetical protein